RSRLRWPRRAGPGPSSARLRALRGRPGGGGATRRVLDWPSRSFSAAVRPPAGGVGRAALAALPPGVGRAVVAATAATGTRMSLGAPPRRHLRQRRQGLRTVGLQGVDQLPGDLG